MEDQPAPAVVPQHPSAEFQALSNALGNANSRIVALEAQQHRTWQALHTLDALARRLENQLNALQIFQRYGEVIDGEFTELKDGTAKAMDASNGGAAKEAG